MLNKICFFFFCKKKLINALELCAVLSRGNDDRRRSMQVQRKAMTCAFDWSAAVCAGWIVEKYFMREFFLSIEAYSLQISFMHLETELKKHFFSLHFDASFFPCSCQVSAFSIVSYFFSHSVALQPTTTIPSACTKSSRFCELHNFFFFFASSIVFVIASNTYFPSTRWLIKVEVFVWVVRKKKNEIEFMSQVY